VISLLTKRALCATLFSVINYPVFASGTGVSGGGRVVECQTEPASYQVFDYYENESLRGWTVNYANESKNYVEQTKIIIQRIAERDSLRADLYLNWLSTFEKELALIAALPTIEDQETVIDPPAGCKTVQIAIQKQPQFPGDKRYFINRGIWDRLSGSIKAGVVLHELMYREARDVFGATDSRGARYLNAMFASGKDKEVAPDLKSYFEVLKAAGFKSGSYFGVPLDVTKVIRWYKKSQFIEWGVVFDKILADTPVGRIKITCDVRFNQHGKILAFSSYVNERVYLPNDNNQSVFLEPNSECNSDVSYYSNEETSDLTVRTTTWYHTRLDDGTPLLVTGLLRFDTSGKLYHASHLQESNASVLNLILKSGLAMQV
jgi:hypothetical protein